MQTRCAYGQVRGPNESVGPGQQKPLRAEGERLLQMASSRIQCERVRNKLERIPFAHRSILRLAPGPLLL